MRIGKGLEFRPTDNTISMRWERFFSVRFIVHLGFAGRSCTMSLRVYEWMGRRSSRCAMATGLYAMLLSIDVIDAVIYVVNTAMKKKHLSSSADIEHRFAGVKHT